MKDKLEARSKKLENSALVLRSLFVVVLVAGFSGCQSIAHRVDQVRNIGDSYDAPFYTRYLDPADPNDRQIQQLVEVLRADAKNAAAHNELGMLLVRKRFPNDAEREFERAIRADREFYPAWFNLGLLRQTKDDVPGAINALRKTVDLKPGHDRAHFELGLIYEKLGQNNRAVDHYVRAYTINPALLDIRQNPRVVDTELEDRALLRMYPATYARRSARYQAAPPDYVQPGSIPEPDAAPSEQPNPADIVTPAQPVTEPSQQPQQPTPPQNPPN